MRISETSQNWIESIDLSGVPIPFKTIIQQYAVDHMAILDLTSDYSDEPLISSAQYLEKQKERAIRQVQNLIQWARGPKEYDDFFNHNYTSGPGYELFNGEMLKFIFQGTEIEVLTAPAALDFGQPNQSPPDYIICEKNETNYDCLFSLDIVRMYKNKGRFFKHINKPLSSSTFQFAYPDMNPDDMVIEGFRTADDPTKFAQEYAEQNATDIARLLLIRLEEAMNTHYEKSEFTAFDKLGRAYKILINKYLHLLSN